MQPSVFCRDFCGFFFFLIQNLTGNDTDLSTGITSELHFWLVFNLKNTFAEPNLDISIQMELNSMSILTEKQIDCWLLYFRLDLNFLMENIKM